MTHVHSTEEQICIKSCGHTEKKRTCFPHENTSGVHLCGAVILALYSAHETSGMHHFVSSSTGGTQESWCESSVEGLKTAGGLECMT